jgi:hypothetical protein
MATISDLGVINAAATRTGNDPITTLASDGTPVAKIALNNYEDSVRTELALYPWKRATKIVQLDRIDPDVMGAPPEPWTASYQQPDDLIEIRTVKVVGYPINYEVHGDTILCNANTADNVILHYIWRVPEVQWPPWFREGMIRRWEAILLRGVGERHNEADERDKAAGESFARARNRDAQSQTPRDPMISPTLQARTGSFPSAAPRPWPSWPWG